MMEREWETRLAKCGSFRGLTDGAPLVISCTSRGVKASRMKYWQAVIVFT
jgi:hypothetical protein